jgi:hypothetical protein
LRRVAIKVGGEHAVDRTALHAMPPDPRSFDNQRKFASRRGACSGRKQQWS